MANCCVYHAQYTRNQLSYIDELLQEARTLEAQMRTKLDRLHHRSHPDYSAQVEEHRLDQNKRLKQATLLAWNEYNCARKTLDYKLRTQLSYTIMRHECYQDLKWQVDRTQRRLRGIVAEWWDKEVVWVAMEVKVMEMEVADGPEGRRARMILDSLKGDFDMD